MSERLYLLWRDEDVIELGNIAKGDADPWPYSIVRREWPVMKQLIRTEHKLSDRQYYDEISKFELKTICTGPYAGFIEFNLPDELETRLEEIEVTYSAIIKETYDRVYKRDFTIEFKKKRSFGHGR